MNEPTDMVTTVPGMGGDAPRIADDVLDTLKAGIADIAGRTESFSVMRFNGERTRFNVWTGQSADGRQHAKDLGQDPELFEGASDQRVFSVDMLCNEQAILRITALARMQYRCEPVNGKADSRKAGKRTILLRWIVKRLGVSWLEEHIRLTQYEMQDTPAVALMRIWWKRESTLEMQVVTVEELSALWTQEFMQRATAAGSEPDPDTIAASAQAFQATLQDDGIGVPELAEIIQRFFPRLTSRRAEMIVRQIRRNGKAEFPVPAIAYEGPAIRARRFAEDFYVPNNMREFDDCPFWFEPEWLSAQELRAKIAADEWSKQWVEDLLKSNAGNAVFDEYTPDGSGWVTKADIKDHRNEYQVVWCWFIANNEDDVPARYYTVMHPSVDGTAFGRRMHFDGKRWPGVLHRREVLDKFSLNSRGIPEIEGPSQGVVKLLRDLSVDNANIGALPPFMTYGHSNKGSIDLAPLAHLPLRQGGEAKFMQPPVFPAAARQVTEDIRADRDAYWGRETKDSAPGLVTMQREFNLALFMERVRLELQMLMDLAVKYMPDEDLMRVLDERGDPVAKTMEELSGQYDVTVAFDPADLDTQSVIDRVKAMKDVLMAVDTDKIINASPVVQYAMRILFPQLQSDAIRPENVGQDEELRQERQNYTNIRAGAMPPMVTDGTWNYQARRQMYEDMLAQNPAVFADMATDKQAMLEQWIKFLDQQVQQFGENVRTGQTGATGGEAGAGGENGGGASAGPTGSMQ